MSFSASFAAFRALLPEYEPGLEWGVVDGIDQSWRTVPLSRTYTHPVVVAKPVSSRGGDPGVVRMEEASQDAETTHVAEGISVFACE